eukprot:gnl/MRDRNA2_/MRDRNA2_280376_c0_seq1.p1 gnl/MRDRNA2_/MRDRNA2_280376_c0~~gnl/MRDRNA2_/MRDRNA2_280376_c0_seq1.p1  ORF type:complete len:135 (+),score=18.79 gnl/MRDRNA2_/MRDRNA2_280376_c0_seq1:108-512(+)
MLSSCRDLEQWQEQCQRVAFLLFTGGMVMGSRSRQSACGSFGYLGVVANPGNTTFVASNGLSMMHQLFDCCSMRESVVLLLLEMHDYVDNAGFAAEVWQMVDGVRALHEWAILSIVATTNKDISRFPLTFNTEP